MSLLINIDTGGTLTDFCIIDGERVHRTKSVTTPFDLSRCLFEGLTKASRELYGEEDLQRLLLATEHIRYSTTQGTNALVERKGPRLGLIRLSSLAAVDLDRDEAARELYSTLVADRSSTVDASLDDEAFERACVAAVNSVAVKGAARLIVSGAAADERRVKRVLLRKFPPHLLGALPVLYGQELVADPDDVRRTWTALFNAFLHPAMERFLYSAEHRLQDHKIRKPLLVFRNDGAASRVARTTAIKTYSSGPRGGAEALRALAVHYEFSHVAGMDVGGTTTDITSVTDGEIRTDQHGAIEGVRSSLPLCDVISVGVGGSSIIRVVDETVRVGPESVGGAPGPACFGLGGTAATITDALVVMGLLDPATYFGGGMKLDIDAARNVIERQIAVPLKVDLETALARMQSAWVDKVVESMTTAARMTADTVLVAFGGAGPLLATRIAAAAGVNRVLIPALAAVLSAFGVGFSDIEHEFEATVADTSPAILEAQLLERARRAMFAEGIDLSDCRIEVAQRAGVMSLRAVKPVPRARLQGRFTGKAVAVEADRHRKVQGRDLPMIHLPDLPAGSGGRGPMVLEDPYFTALLDPDWAFERSGAGDLLLSRRSSEASKT